MTPKQEKRQRRESRKLSRHDHWTRILNDGKDKTFDECANIVETQMTNELKESPGMKQEIEEDGVEFIGYVADVFKKALKNNKL